LDVLDAIGHLLLALRLFSLAFHKLAIALIYHLPCQLRTDLEYLAAAGPIRARLLQLLRGKLISLLRQLLGPMFVTLNLYHPLIEVLGTLARVKDAD
jgi:hypothetical protein